MTHAELIDYLHDCEQDPAAPMASANRSARDRALPLADVEDVTAPIGYSTPSALARPWIGPGAPRSAVPQTEARPHHDLALRSEATPVPVGGLEEGVGQLGAIRDRQLGVHAREMRLDGRGAHEEPCADVLVG